MKYILELLLYSPRVYAGLDHLMVYAAREARKQGYTLVCVYCDKMNEQPDIQRDIEMAGGVVELVSSNLQRMRGDIFRLYAKYHPKVVDTHFIVRIKLWTALLSLLYGARHYTHEHSMLGRSIHKYVRRKGWTRRFLNGTYLCLVNLLSNKVLCASNAIRKQYCNFCYGSKKKIEVMYIGTEIREPRYTQEQARRLTGVPLDAKVIANVSSFDPVKGIDVLFAALSLLKNRGVNFIFVSVGGMRKVTPESQDYVDSLQELAYHYEIENQIIWLGRRNDVQDILPLADVYVHPSRSEGLACVLLEASVARLPLVCSREGGMVEVVLNRQNGLVVPKEDPAALADAIQQLLEHPDNDYGERARERVEEIFNQERQARLLIHMQIGKPIKND